MPSCCFRGAGHVDTLFNSPAKAAFATETSNNKADHLEHRDLGKPLNLFGASRLSVTHACEKAILRYCSAKHVEERSSNSNALLPPIAAVFITGIITSCSQLKGYSKPCSHSVSQHRQLAFGTLTSRFERELLERPKRMWRGCALNPAHQRRAALWDRDKRSPDLK